MGLDEEFEKLAEKNLDGVKVFKIDGFNESPSFKAPNKLPAVFLFQRNSEGEVVTTELDKHELLEAYKVKNGEQRVDSAVLHHTLTTFALRAK